MTTYNTGNPVPSADARDRFDNSQTFDELITGSAPAAIDRLGRQRTSWAGFNDQFNQFLINSGYEPVHLTYVVGSPLVVNRPTQLIDYNGSVYRVKTPATFPVTLTGTWATDQASLVDVGDQSLRQALANGTSYLVDSAVVGYFYRTAQDRLRADGLSPSDFGPARALGDDWLNEFNLCLAQCKALRVPFNIEKFYMVSNTVVIDGFNGLWIKGNGTIRGSSSTAQFVLDITNSTAVTSDGDIIIDGDSKTNLSAAIRVAGLGTGTGGALNTCSLHHLKFNAINAPCGWQIGDFTAPDNLISEIKLRGYTYNTPIGMIVIGAQAVIDITGMDLVAAGQGVFETYTHSLIINHGGSVTGVGSELQMPSVSTGLGLVSCPINSPGFTNKYGSFSFAGCQVECASIHFFAYNPNSVPSPEPGTGGLRLTNCYGYASYPNPLYQDAAGSGFSGSIIVDDTNEFFANAIRTQPTATILGTAKVKLSDDAFNDNFFKDLKAINGGVALFDSRQIFEATTLPSGTPVSSGNFTFAFSSIALADNNTHFYDRYNTTTGVFTVPTGGLKSVRVQVNFQNSQPNSASALSVLVNGAIVGSTGANTNFVSGSFDIGDIAAGSTIVVRFYNAGSSFSPVGGSQDRMTISARR